MLATQVKQDDDKGDSIVKERKVCYSAVFLRSDLSCLVETTLSKSMARCVGRNSKEMVRQESAAREFASATVSKCF